MKKKKEQVKVQITFDPEAYDTILKVIKTANENFDDGTVNFSHCVNFAVMNTKYNLIDLQKSSIHTTKLMQNVYQESKFEDNVLIEALLKVRSELRSRKQKAVSKKDEVNHEA